MCSLAETPDLRACDLSPVPLTCELPHHPLLNLHFVSEPLHPHHIRLATEPCQLSLRVVAMGLLGRGDGSFTSEFATQELRRLLVPQRCDWARGIPIFLEQVLRLLYQATLEHATGPLVDARVQRVPVRVQADAPDAKTG